jgi:hypothetical protein
MTTLQLAHIPLLIPFILVVLALVAVWIFSDNDPKGGPPYA